MEIPYSIRNIIGDRPYSVDCVGMSDAQVICFEDMVLKIGPVSYTHLDVYKRQR